MNQLNVSFSLAYKSVSISPVKTSTLSLRLYILMGDSYPSPLKVTFSVSGPFPNIFILTQIPAVTWDAHWVPSESIGLQL